MSLGGYFSCVDFFIYLISSLIIMMTPIALSLSFITPSLRRHSAIPRIAMFNGRKILGDNVPVSLQFNLVTDILVANML
jgi:hypothetical protein